MVPDVPKDTGSVHSGLMHTGLAAVTDPAATDPAATDPMHYVDALADIENKASQNRPPAVPSTGPAPRVADGVRRVSPQRALHTGCSVVDTAPHLRIRSCGRETRTGRVGWHQIAHWRVTVFDPRRMAALPPHLHQFLSSWQPAGTRSFDDGSYHCASVSLGTHDCSIRASV